MPRHPKINILYLYILLLGACTSNSKTHPSEKLVVFAAASLNEVTQELLDSFQVQYPVEVRTNFASSGTLARQITHGAQADLFLSANRQWVNYLDSVGLIVADPVVFATNKLVVIASDSSFANSEGFDLIQSLGDRRLAIGDPSHVPVGIYAKAALQHQQIYDSLQDQLFLAKDARSALMMVELGECPFGLTYRSDALRSQKVSIVREIDLEERLPIEYLAAPCNPSPVAKEFLNFLRSDRARSILERHFFEEPENEGKGKEFE